MDRDIAKLLPSRPNERWLDLGFRIVIVLLAGFWLLAPPAAGEMRGTELKAALATR